MLKLQLRKESIILFLRQTKNKTNKNYENTMKGKTEYCGHYPVPRDTVFLDI